MSLYYIFLFSLLKMSTGLRLQRSTENPKRIHILSMGRVGSCFTMGLLKDEGACIFEPLNGLVEGSGTLSRRLTGGSHVQCLYDCNKCKSGDVNAGSLQQLNSYCSSKDAHPEEPLIIKTTRVIDLEVLVDSVETKDLMDTRFVMLLRDPRGVWASTKPMYGWAIRSIPHICKALMIQAFSLPELLAKVGKEKIHVGFFEQWTLDPEAYALDLATLVSASDEVKEQMRTKGADGKQKPNLKWVTTLEEAELNQIENNQHCAAYMRRVGYKNGLKEGQDYSAVKMENLLKDLTDEERALLQQLRAEVGFNKLTTNQELDQEEDRILFYPRGEYSNDDSSLDN